MPAKGLLSEASAKSKFSLTWASYMIINLSLRSAQYSPSLLSYQENLRKCHDKLTESALWVLHSGCGIGACTFSFTLGFLS